MTNKALEDLKSAIAFLDKCRDRPAEASESGAFKDAHEWVLDGRESREPVSATTCYCEKCGLRMMELKGDWRYCKFCQPKASLT